MKTQAGIGRMGRGAGALIVAVAAVGAMAALPGQARAADGGALPPYAFDGTAPRVKGAASSSDAAQLQPGQTYRDTLKKDAKVYYRVDLDDKLNSYVSVVAVPKPGGKVEYGDGFKVSMQDGSGTDCGYQQVSFSSAEYARPLAGYARRIVDKESSTCQKAGAFYVLVERTSKPTSASDDWELEIRHLSEPALKKAGPTELPEAWSSATPPPPTGGPQKRQGGAGFHDAVSLTQGEWRSDIRPGQTLFYRVPVDWGQQLFATAELGSSTAGDEYVGNALVLSLDNPALGHVDESTGSYDGKQTTLALDPQRPVAHENRTSYNDAANGMRFAGWYYLSATLSPEIAKEYGDKPVPLTLRVSVTGNAKPGPGYDGDPGPFAVTAGDKEAAANGASGARAAEGNDSMRLLAVAGIGTGTALLLGLGGWTLMARRRAA
ncbi:hypothetical protein H4W23_20285 [Streptomyces gardneri]|uniref:hypothetical protein n=1 Tax=Streptomyces gardneri TaxID=66892 RepID=UPI0006BD6811|nr:hypothetical protein [Streptomyces gardneri]QPK46734.1 hypothetical protein H4W23_20285 [Streptomyces gardneri]WRK38132.1 hypothetical protein U0M97_20385 [Streptomyces venezuelae]CUM39910.1 FIG01123933: hypothetical protein [Streptomyces venezuelae]